MPVKFVWCCARTHLLCRAVLDEYFERCEEFFIGDVGVETIGRQDIVKEVATHIKEHLTNPVRQKGAPLYLCICLRCVLVVAGPVHVEVKRAHLISLIVEGIRGYPVEELGRCVRI